MLKICSELSKDFSMRGAIERPLCPLLNIIECTLSIAPLPSADLKHFLNFSPLLLNMAANILYLESICFPQMHQPESIRQLVETPESIRNWLLRQCRLKSMIRAGAFVENKYFPSHTKRRLLSVNVSRYIKTSIGFEFYHRPLWSSG